jgi:8-amino-3,8-dideoxy-alpha-D-manno-octulosonate transaminase
MPGFELIGVEEQSEINDIFNNGGILFRHGFDAIRNNCYKVQAFEKAFAARMKVPYALAVTSGTAALRVALSVLDIQPEDEVITQSFTFVATVEAIIESRAIPVCTEIDAGFNMDIADLKSKIGPKTKAVIVVHMLGTPAKLKEIKQICDSHNIPLIEDSAWGCGGSYDGVPLGTYGNMGTYSFDFAKTMTTGEGGMVVFQNKTDYEKAAAWHDHGHENNPTVPRWEDTRASSGFNFRMSELQGAVGIAQLRKLDYVVATQNKNKQALEKAIEALPNITKREVPLGAYETADALVFMVPNKEMALAVRTELLKEGISTKILPEATTWHFSATWTHMPELMLRHGTDLANAFPVSKNLLERAVSLPVKVIFEDDFVQRVEKAVRKVLNN